MKQAELRRERKGEYCTLEVEMREGRLSICGTYGEIVTPKAARAQARDYWESYFEDAPEEIIRLGRRTAKGAARYVLEVDGEYHGLDVDDEYGEKVYLVQGGGQIVRELNEWFPEIAHWLPYHLNDMKAECIHQEARGESWTTHPLAECPDCGYKLGSAWQRRELPADIVEEISQFLEDRSLPDMRRGA